MDFPFPTTPEQAGRGKLVSYISPCSGAGATSLACMNAICSSINNETALIDFNPEGKARSYLGLTEDVTTASILDILSVSKTSDLYSVAEKHSISGIYVFPGVFRIMDIPQIDAHLQLKATTYLKQTFERSYAILGPLYNSSWITAMLSDVICIVVTPNRHDMDSFREYIEFLKRLGCEDRMKIILNQQKIPEGIKEEDSIKYYSPDLIIPYNNKIRKQCNLRNFTLDSTYKNYFYKIGVV